MKKQLVSAVAFALGLAASSASAFTLYNSPNINNFEDDNIDYFSFDANGDGLLDVGDRLTALVDFNVLTELSPAFSPTGNSQVLNELTGITEIEVINKVDLGNGSFLLEFGASAAFEATYGAGAMLALFDDPGGTLNIVTNCSSVAGCQPEAVDGNLWAVFGLDPLDGDTFWASVGSDDVGTATGALPTTKLATINFALNILTNNTGALVSRDLPAPCGLPGFACTGDGLVDMVGSADILGGAGLDPNHVRSDSDFLFRATAVPEPATLALLGLGLAGLGFSRRKRQ